MYYTEMIGFLQGIIIHTTDRHIILDVHGVGYLISVTSELLERASKSNNNLNLWIHTIIREDVFDLYGFELEDELEFFKLLIKVSGIGPRGALGILSVAPLNTLHSAIHSGETSYLTKVSGVGRKSAEKIVLELRDKLPNISISQNNIIMKEDMDVLEALQALGYNQSDARSALKEIPSDITGTSSRITSALKLLGQHNQHENT